MPFSIEYRLAFISRAEWLLAVCAAVDVGVERFQAERQPEKNAEEKEEQCAAYPPAAGHHSFNECKSLVLTKVTSYLTWPIRPK